MPPNENAWFTPRRFAALLAALVLVSYPRVFLGLRTFVYHDFGYFSYPLAWHLRECFWRGEWPLWNPLNNCGEPFLAQWNTQALYPPALFYLLFPLPWSLGVFCLLHLWIGGLGMHRLARQWTQDHGFAAAVAGVAYAFSGLLLSALVWPATISALAWMPWVVWLVERAWREGCRRLFPAVLTGALQMLTGGVEVILLTWSLLAALVMLDFVRGGLPLGRLLLRVALVVALISGLCAAQLLPFFDLLEHSQRQPGYFTADSPMPPTGWANFLVPLFGCRPENGVFLQAGQYWLVSYYAGVVILALALWAIGRVRQARVWLLAAFALGGILLALGNATPIYGWFYRHVSVIGLVRFPVKFLILPAFALPLLAACGLTTKPENGRSGRPWFFTWLAFAATVTAVMIWALRSPSTDGNGPAVLFNGLARLICFSAISAVLFVLGKARGGRGRHALQLLVLVVLWLDLFRQVPPPPTVSPDLYQPGMARGLPAPQFGTARAMISNAMRTKLIFSVNAGAVDDYRAHRFALFSDCNLLDDLPKCDGFFPLELREQSLLDGDLSEPLADFLGASETLGIRSNAWTWTERGHPMPLMTGGQAARFAADGLTRLELAGTNFDPRAEVYLPPEAAGLVTATNPAVVTIAPLKISSQEIDAEATANGPAMLVVAQTYYHPWQARVDGHRTELWRANGAFQALEMPAGRHRVELAYRDANFRLGLAVSLATLVVCGIGWVFMPKGRSR